MSRARRCGCFALLVMAHGWIACVGLGIGRDELGERPFALLWFDPETQRRRAELIQDSDPRGDKVGPAGTVYVEAFAEYLSRAFGIGDPEDAKGGSMHARLTRRFPGRLALVKPGESDATLLPATPGARPQDWSNDGHRLLYTQLSGRFLQLFIYDLRTETVQPVRLGTEVHVGGCFGPEERLLVVASGVDEGGLAYSRLDLTEPGGMRPEPFTEGPSDFDVACAPDGSAVAWSHVGRNGREYIMTRMPVLDGPVRDLGEGRFPAFSPDSEWIAYSRRGRDNRWALHRIRADGSGRRPVGQGTRNEIQPTFSPDGRLVLYVSDNGFDERIYVRRFDGTGDRILIDSGGGIDPVW